MDRATFAIERAKLKALEKMRDTAHQRGETDAYADLVREVRTSQKKIQQILRCAF